MQRQRRRRRVIPFMTVMLLLGMSLSMTACPAKGPAQKAGRAIDRATGN